MTPILLLAIAACQTPEAETGPQQDFEAWIQGLPEAEGFQAFTARYRMTARMDLMAMQGMQGEDLQMEIEKEGIRPKELVMTMRLEGRWDAGGPVQHRVDGKFEMDFSLLRREGIEEPIKLDFLVVSDGETIYVEPTYRNEWMLEELRKSKTGFENKVFSLRMDALKRFLDDLGVYMEQEAPGILRGRSYTELMAESMDPRSWIRVCKDYASVEGFRIEGDVVHLQLEPSEDWLDAVGTDPAMQGVFADDWTYLIELDRGTGIARKMLVRLGEDAMDFEVSMDVEMVKAFPEGHFRYEMPEEKSPWDVSPFLDLARQGMQPEYGQEDLDF